ncbi:hypothetical protein STEG23_013111 [Scotinomys teguina]
MCRMCRLSWFLDPGGWGKAAMVGLYFIFLRICTLSLLEWRKTDVKIDFATLPSKKRIYSAWIIFPHYMKFPFGRRRQIILKCNFQDDLQLGLVPDLGSLIENVLAPQQRLLRVLGLKMENVLKKAGFFPTCPYHTLKDCCCAYGDPVQWLTAVL